MNTLPDKTFLRRSEVRLFLGVSQSTMSTLVRSGVLKPRVLPGMTYAYYERSEVIKAKEELTQRQTQGRKETTEK